jgi:hypothetical protein
MRAGWSSFFFQVADVYADDHRHGVPTASPSRASVRARAGSAEQ